MSFLTLFHVLAGTAAVLAGAVTLAAPKGRALHVAAGRFFVVTMLVSSAAGAALGLLKHETFFIAFHAGVLATYLVLSGWLAAIRHGRTPRWMVIATSILNLANLAGLLGAGIVALKSNTGQLFGFPAEDYFFLSLMSLAGALTDASLAFRKSLAERHRIARHLWRMCLGFFIAAGSAFTGPGAKAFPEVLHDSGLLSLPEFLILAALIYWLIRTLFGLDRSARSR